MAYERLQSLGEEKFGKILNQLVRGEPATGVSRMIQHEWKDFQDVSEKTLVQQLNRLRLHAAEGMFGKAAAKQLMDGQTPTVIKRIENLSIGVLERMEELGTIQRQRMLDLVEKEKKMPVPVGAMLSATNAVFNDYRQLLLDLQKIRFDLGVDEFKGPLTTTTMMRGAHASMNLPDGTNVQKQVFEAVTSVEAIFNARKIPQTVSG
jgi:hypothetical protein